LLKSTTPHLTLNTTHSARNLGFIFDEHLTFSDQSSSVSKSCNYHIRQLRCIRPYLDSKTASTIATSIVHSKLDYCNSLYYNLPKSQITRLQQIQNSLARAVAKAPKSSHITPILRCLHWVKITERIEYKLLSLAYKVLRTTQPSYLHNLITVVVCAFRRVVMVSHCSSFFHRFNCFSSVLLLMSRVICFAPAQCIGRLLFQVGIKRFR